MRDFLKILRYTNKYSKERILVILNNILFVLFNLLSLLLFIPFLKLIFIEGDGEVPQAPHDGMSFKVYWETKYNYEMYEFLQTNGKVQALAYICVAILICFLLKNIFRYMAMFYLAEIRNGVVRDLRNNIHKKMVNLELGFLSEERKGDLMARAMSDVQEVEVSIMGTLELLFREPLAIVMTLSTLFFISAKFTLFSLILLPLSALIISRIGKSLKRSSKKAQDKLGQLSASLEETLSGIRIIKAFSAEESVHNKFEKINDEHKTVLNKAFRKRDLASPVNEVMGTMVMIALVWFGGSIVLKGDSLSGSTFLGFIIVFSQLLRPIQGVANSISNVNKGLASIERINKILDVETTILDPENPSELAGLNSGVSYKNVFFSYPGTEEVVLKDVSFHVEKGKTVALVGESGGGKSTIADLLPRFYDCNEGAIEIDGINLKDYSKKSIRNRMGIVTQQSILFNDTIRNNIAFGTKGVSDEAIEEAAKIANAHEFISAFPNGYDTNIGDAGSKLSGGQKQRLSIARAVLKNPDILILDEATSALDTESEKLVQDALIKLMQNRTSLVIAHRLSTIKHADEILVLQKGEIVERGKHQELFEKQGVYRNLCDLQSFS